MDRVSVRYFELPYVFLLEDMSSFCKKKKLSYENQKKAKLSSFLP